MVRQLVSALAVLALCLGVTLAGEARVVITKVEGNHVTFAEVQGDGRGPTKTLPAADHIKVTHGQFNPHTARFDAGQPVERGLRNEVFSKMGPQGLFATVVTDADKQTVVEIRLATAAAKAKDP